MSIREYIIIDDLTCEKCDGTEDVVYDEGGREICTDCLFEEQCEETINIHENPELVEESE